MSDKHWRCFHCDEVFTDEAAAREHFGPTMIHSPACTIDVAEYRAMERRMFAYNAEDSDMHRQLAAMESKHGEAMRREEEKGYARGLQASTAALATLDRLRYTYTQGAELWKPPLGPNPFASGGRLECKPGGCSAIGCEGGHYCFNADGTPKAAACQCEACKPNIAGFYVRMILCQICGNKRCPHATNHENACTGSNEVGQKGSSWESVKAPVTKPRSTPYEQRHCQNGHEACLAGRRDGVVCPDDSCDIDDGVRKA